MCSQQTLKNIQATKRCQRSPRFSTYFLVKRSYAASQEVPTEHIYI